MGVWRDLATTLGGRYHEDHKGRRIEAVRRDTNVTLEHYRVTAGDELGHDCRAYAAYRLGPGPRMHVQKHDSLFRGRHIKVGHRAFDKWYVLKGDRPAVVRRLWSDATIGEMLYWFRAYIDLTSDKQWVSLTMHRVILTHVPTMLAAIDLVVEFANRDFYGVNALKDLGAMATGPNGWPCAELDTGIRVVVGAEDRDGKLVMAARATVDIETIEVVNGRFDALLPHHAHEVGTGTLSKSGFVWRDLELDPARLRAGAQLLGALASSRTVYR